MKKQAIRLAMLLGALAFIAACQQVAGPAAVAVRPARDPNSAVMAIRAAGAKLESSVEVKPLRDPAVDGLLKQARDLETQSQPGPALEAVRRAQKIAGNAPDLLQYEAELQVELRDWSGAAATAKQSYDAGPKVGALCARNQQTLIEARSALGDDAAAQVARQQLTACNVPAPARY